MQNLRWLSALLFWSIFRCDLDAGPIRVATWNMDNFPSGKYSVRSPEIEPQRIKQAAAVISSLGPDILLLQEVRDLETCESLAKALLPEIYEVCICSRFKDAAGLLTYQQIAILSKHQTQYAFAEVWKSDGRIHPPRGFVFAATKIGNQLLGFYSVHLKSNRTYGRGAMELQKNILKREISAQQLVAHMKEIQKEDRFSAFIIGGDLNTNRDNPDYVSEGTLRTIRSMGFVDAFGRLAPSDRVTWPARGRYDDATFDYIFSSGGTILHTTITTNTTSDHNLVTADFTIGALLP